MPFESLSEFLSALHDAGELVRVSAPVDSALELSAITEQIVKSSPDGAPAILFESVKNSSIPVVTNLLGNKKRLCQCLGIADLSQLLPGLQQRLASESTSGWWNSMTRSSPWGSPGKWASRLVKTAACQQVVRMGRDISLWELPAPRCWPEELHPTITSGLILTTDPTTRQNTVFQSSLAVVGPQELAWYDGTTAEKTIVESVLASQQNLPVAISLGGDPLLNLSIGLPDVRDAIVFAGFLRGAGLEVVRCRTNELEVPANAEIIIEGYIDAKRIRSEEPIAIARGNGRYVERSLPLIQVTAVTHRANPLFPVTVIAPPLSEESWVCQATDKLLLFFLRNQLPEVVEIRRPASSAGRNLLFVSINKWTDHQARRIIHALWGMESIGQTKLIVVVDAETNLESDDEVWLAVGTNANPERDFLFSDGLARDDDYTSLSNSLSSRVGIDATRKRNGQLVMSDDILARVRLRSSELGFTK